ncbi:DUF5123 domain-containing protein [Chitinophagaceae bacterium LB-8]|uniref:DUF5123 domain-containing protein n=1 Tax=Paraflavisolibacter caeni TaxID=2982496 RepID=A0A9X3BGL4_9BACT|nr:DUF5123 domain-containing protein [Paraflavisolibacter caeni]MCU7547987.1 DUF5123 domain-containing protein [Paraflavisolibacter caeni]
MRNLILGFGAVLMALASCQKEDLPEATRLFRPVAKEGLVSEANWVSASWQKITGASSYTVQISRDTFRTIDATINIDTSYAVFQDLKWNQLYQVQVKANAQDTVKNSKYSNLGGIKTPKFPTILATPTVNDVSDEAIKVSWTNSGATVTSIKVLKGSDSSLVKEVTLTSTDVSNKYKIINGLAGSSQYIVYLYSGTTVRGWDNYTTKAPLSGTLVDLRSIADRPSVLADTLPLIPNGSTVILKRGYTYNIATGLSLDKSVTILSGSDLLVTEPATIYFTGNFNLVAGSNIDYIDFKNVKLVGSDYTGKYVVNANAAANVGRLSFESCVARVFRGMVRLQTAAVNITNFTINDCVIDSVGNYGVVNVDVALSKIENITIKNSTIFKTEKVITSKQNSTTVTVENCTINEAPLGGNYFIDYSTSGTNNVSGGIKIAGCIFGIGKGTTATPPVTAFRGARFGASTNIDVSGSYKTTDVVFTSNDLPNLIAYTKSYTELWQGPATGDFKIKDNTFAGKATAGDPRWR